MLFLPSVFCLWFQDASYGFVWQDHQLPGKEWFSACHGDHLTLWPNYSKKEIYKSWLLLLLIAGVPDQSTLLNQTDSPDFLTDTDST